MSLLEAPCAKTSWRALLFRAILGITGALIVCFDIWWFKQVNNSETGFSGHHCDFEQHVPCLAVHVCMNSVKFVLKAPGASILWGRYYSVTMCRLIRWALLLGRALLIGTLRYIYFEEIICMCLRSPFIRHGAEKSLSNIQRDYERAYRNAEFTI